MNEPLQQDRCDVDVVNRTMERASAEDILLWTVRRFGSRAVMTCSFGGGGLVLAHMTARHRLDVPILFLDTGYHFPQTLAFRREFARRYDLDVHDVVPVRSVAEQDELFGPRLYERDADACCRMRKVEPLAAALRARKPAAWITGLRRDQGGRRKNIAVLEDHDLGGGQRVVKVHPLARWTRNDVWDYIKEHNVPYHPLLDDGYTSIGCAPCTVRPAVPGDERSGRWVGTGKTECGLHTFSRQTDD